MLEAELNRDEDTESGKEQEGANDRSSFLFFEDFAVAFVVVEDVGFHEFAFGWIVVETLLAFAVV